MTKALENPANPQKEQESASHEPAGSDTVTELV
jgi:hypothetical protein